MKDRMVSNNVHSICQDSSGFIWIATEEGLSIFDSKSFRNLTTSEGLLYNNIDFITADKYKKGVVWISYANKGLDRFGNGKVEHFLKKLPEGMQFINTIYQDSDSLIWCGTDSSFFIIKDNRIIKFDKDRKVKGIAAFAEDTSGNILISGNNGLFIFNKATEKIYRDGTFSANISGRIVSIYVENDGTKWLLTNNGILVKRAGENIKYLNLKPGRFYRGMISSSDNNFFYVYSDNGLFKINKSSLRTWSMFSEKSGLPSNNIRCALMGREGILWLGLNDNGLSKLVYPNLYLFTLKKYYTFSVIDNNAHIWITTATGLKEIWKTENGTWKIFDHPIPPIFRQPQNTFIFYRNKSLILTLEHGRILQYSIKNRNPLSEYPSRIILKKETDLSMNYKFAVIFKSIEDNYGDIWTSALDLGVIVLNKNKKVIKIYTDQNGMPDNSVRCIYQDPSGNFWFGGYDKGLAFFSKDKVLRDLGMNYTPADVKQKIFTTKDGLPGNSIRKIIEDSSGNIIIGTRYGGLAVYKGGIIKKITKSNGLISDGIWDIANDGDKGIWIVTQAGVQRLKKGFVPSYELNEEVTNNPYYTIAVKNNLITFSSKTSLYLYDRTSKREHISPSIYFTQILVNGKPFDLKENEILASEQDNITFDFAGISNIEDKNTSYNYRMLDIDKQWHNLSNKGTVTYASLKPGKYKFQVNAINSDNISSSHPASVSFIISQPFYLEWWFISAWILVILIASYLYINIKNRRKLEIEKLRMKIAGDLHDEIGSGLTKIAILSEHVLKEQEAQKSDNEIVEDQQASISINRVGKIARDLVDQMIDVIWSIDPKYDSLNDFVFSFKNFAYETCEAKNIELLINTENINNVKVNSQIKRGLQLIAKEALNNAVKYSDCTKITFNLEVKNRNIILLIMDNGKGFSRDKIIPGKGLLNIEKNTNEMLGWCSIESYPEQGTKIEIIFPLQK